MSIFSPIRYTSSDGLALYARDYHGAGGPARLPVICIHGLTRNSLDFDELARADVAHAMLAMIDDPATVKQGVGVAY